MKKIFYFFAILFILIFLFDGKILNFFLSKKISQLTEYDTELNISKLNYFKGELEINKIKIKNKRNLVSSTFDANLIVIDFNFKSLFSNLVILNNVTILDPKFYFEIKDIKQELNKKKSTNKLNLAGSVSKENLPKIYPQKKKDKNFLILTLEIKNSKAVIKYPKNVEDLKIDLSEIIFKKVGNAGKENNNNFQHYKDVMNLILSDIFFKIPDYDLRNLIKKIYKIN